MDSFFSHPATQSAIIPFVTGLVAILLLGKIRPVFSGLSAILAFAITVGMVTGYSLVPFSSTRKIVLIAYLAAIAGLILDLLWDKLSAYQHLAKVVLALISAVAMLWILWPVVSREGTVNPLLTAVGLCTYVAWMVFGTALLSNKKEQLTGALFALSVGTSIIAMIGATVLYGQLAAPYAAVTGAWALVYLFGVQKAHMPLSFYLTGSLVCAMLGAAATVYASLDWIALLMFALIPVTVLIPIKRDSAVWIQLLQSCIAALIPVFAAIWYIVQQSKDSAYYG